jgi:uncharacterized protein
MKQTCEAVRQKAIEQGPDGSYYLVGSKCSSCGKVSFLEREVCPACSSFAGHERVLIGKTGRINNFTVAHVAPAGYTAPYILAFVDLAEGPRIFATIEGDLATAGRLCLGDEVRLVAEANDEPTADGPVRWRYVSVKDKEVDDKCVK